LRDISQPQLTRGLSMEIALHQVRWRRGQLASITGPFALVLGPVNGDAVFGHQTAHNFFANGHPRMAQTPPDPAIPIREMASLRGSHDVLAQAGILIWCGRGLALIIKTRA